MLHVRQAKPPCRHMVIVIQRNHQALTKNGKQENRTLFTLSVGNKCNVHQNSPGRKEFITHLATSPIFGCVPGISSCSSPWFPDPCPAPPVHALTHNGYLNGILPEIWRNKQGMKCHDLHYKSWARWWTVVDDHDCKYPMVHGYMARPSSKCRLINQAYINEYMVTVPSTFTLV